MIVTYPDHEFTLSFDANKQFFKIFLAGTIDNGNSKDWQKELIDAVSNIEHNCDVSFNLFNPRRQNWNPEQSKEIMEEQIKWEQDHLDESDLIIMVFADNSQSPITLLELGLYAKSGKLVVFCTDKFWRYDNVRLTCEKYSIPLIKSTNINVIIDAIKLIYTK